MKAYIIITLEKIGTTQEIADKIHYIQSNRSIIAIDHYGSAAPRALPKIMVVMEFKHNLLDVSEERQHITDTVNTQIKPIPGIKSVNVQFALPVFSYR